MKQQFKDVVVRREDLDVDSAVSHFKRNQQAQHTAAASQFSVTFRVVYQLVNSVGIG